MFQLNDKVLDKNGHIFEIVSVEKQNIMNQTAEYFILQPSFPYDFNKGYIKKIPVDKADELLRYVMNKEEAVQLIESFKGLESFPDINPRERRNFFLKVVSSGDRVEICRVVKTLIEYREERLKQNKPFSDFDRRLLNNLLSLIYHELSISIGIDVNDVQQYIYDKTGLSV